MRKHLIVDIDRVLVDIVEESIYRNNIPVTLKQRLKCQLKTIHEFEFNDIKLVLAIRKGAIEFLETLKKKYLLYIASEI